MIEKEILKLAADVYGCHDWTEAQLNRLRRFADLVAEHEREACAVLCDDLIGTRAMASHCADAIRARGEK